jgi:IclR family transcriptional regulator, KDG regulon repressor
MIEYAPVYEGGVLMLHTIAKVGKVLALFTEKQPEWGVREVARALDIPKSTASVIMRSLAEQDMLTRTSSGRYRLGWRLFELSTVLLKSTDFYTEAHHEMVELVERWGETMDIAVMNGSQVVCVEKLVRTPTLQQLLMKMGKIVPSYSSSAGKVLLAYCDWPELAKQLTNQELPIYTSHTITTLDAFAKELEQVRKQGYAFDNEEIFPGMCGVSAPIRDEAGKVIAAISLLVPTYRFRQQQTRYTSLIRSTAGRVSEKLGYTDEQSHNPYEPHLTYLAH